MLYILYEDPFNEMDSVLFDFYQRYPESCRMQITTRQLSSETLSSLKVSPLLSNGWLVICKAGLSADTVGKVHTCAPQNIVIAMVANSRQLESLVSELPADTYKILDNHKVDKGVVLYWIKKQIVCEMDTAKYLYKRLDGRLRDIVASVNILKMLPIVSKKDVTSYVQKANLFSVSNLVDYIAGVPVQRVMLYTDAVRVVYDFRFASKWLLETICDELTLYIELFTLMSIGEISLHSFKQYQESGANRNIAAIATYKLRRMLEAYGSVSTEYLVYQRQLILNIKPTQFGLCKLVSVISAV